MTKFQSNIYLKSKARTLEELSGLIYSAKVLPLYIFNLSEYKSNQKYILENVQAKFKNNAFLVVRSSSHLEDGSDKSNAGHFTSILNVNSDSVDQIKDAIDKVIQSYGSTLSPTDEVFIQPQLMDISMAGVAFTSDIDTLAPYYTINYDLGGSSDSVTSGKGDNLRTFVYFKYSPIKCNDLRLNALIETLKELEILFDFPHLDVEFAFDSRNELYIFQVRRISLRNKEDLSHIDLRDALLKIHKKIEKISAPHPNLLGKHAVYGVMPDWNPAEIIGIKPKHLAASLYKEMITDSIWAYQRNNYGYRNLRSHPLMLMYLGVPYIDVRVDFNSFIPKELDEHVAHKLADHYLNKLINTPVLHDKVEFEIVHSCFYFNLPQKLSSDLKEANFSTLEIEQIENALLNITASIVDPVIGFYKKDLQKLEILEKKYESILSSELSLVDKIYWLIEDCKRYGTLPFAGIARSAFVATQFLRSFVDLNIFTKEDLMQFSASMKTITKELNNDLYGFSKGSLNKELILEKYGHLRPGTYDISSVRYDEDFEKYFDLSSIQPTELTEFSITHIQKQKIKELIDKFGFKLSVEQLIEFIKNSIEGREYSKFIFTKSLSKVLSLIEQLAKKNNIDKTDLPYVDIKTIINLYASLDYKNVKDILEKDILENKRSYQFTKAVKLPGLIIDPDDVYFYFLENDEPNYITLKTISAEVVKEELINKTELTNKIIFIKSADPGYDFLFTKNIGGLITQYGGANSHMAVRCAELGIPAIIGSGVNQFNLWSNAKQLKIDCLNKQVQIIR